MDGRTKEAKNAKEKDNERYLLSAFYCHMEAVRMNETSISKDECIDWFFRDQEYQREAFQSISDYEKEVWRHNRRLLRVIKKVKGGTFYKYLKEIINECWRVPDKMTIEKEPGGEWQKENYGRTITGIWVDQWATGTEGDSWDGYMWVQMKENKYLKISYSM